MLVLSRKRGERIVVGDREVIITVIDVRGDKVRIGVEAAPDVRIDREEIFELRRKGDDEAEFQDGRTS